MISHKHKCIFVHIPKCAGTSIEKALGHFAGFEGRGGQDHRTLRMVSPYYGLKQSMKSLEGMKEFLQKKKYHLRKHKNPQKNLVVNKEQYDVYYKFTIVRNPWDRLYSWYRNVIRDEAHLRNWGGDPDVSFSSFLKKFIGERHLKSQLDYITNEDGEVKLDFIGKFENLQNDFQVVLNELGLHDVILPHAVKGDSVSSYRDKVDEESREIIASFYAKEIEFLNYKF